MKKQKIDNDKSVDELIKEMDNRPMIFVPNLHKDTDLGVFSAMFVQGLISNSGQCQTFAGNNPESVPSYVVKTAISLAKELIKQLDQEIK